MLICWTNKSVSLTPAIQPGAVPFFATFPFFKLMYRSSNQNITYHRRKEPYLQVSMSFQLLMGGETRDRCQNQGQWRIQTEEVFCSLSNDALGHPARCLGDRQLRVICLVSFPANPKDENPWSTIKIKAHRVLL